MIDREDPRVNRENDKSEEMMMAEALYLYERDLEGEDDLDTEQ